MAGMSAKTGIDKLIFSLAVCIFGLILLMYLLNGGLASASLVRFVSLIFEAMPFGREIAKWSCELIAYVFSFRADVSEVTGSAGTAAGASLLLDFAKLLIATAFYEALFESAKVVRGISDKGKNKFLERVFWSFGCAILATAAMNWSMDILAAQLKSLSNAAQLSITITVTAIAVVGLFLILNKLNTGDSLLYEFFIKGLFIIAVKLVVIYLVASALLIVSVYGNTAVFWLICASALLLLIASEGICLSLSSVFR